MKKLKVTIILSIIFLALTYTNKVLGQELVENKIDDFTGSSIKRTSWESINMTMQFTAYFRISKINDNYYFDLSVTIGNSVFSIGEGQEFMFKLSNDEVVKISNVAFAVTCTGCGVKKFSGSQVQGIRVSYKISKEQIEKLKYNTITKIRIYTNDGYIENDLKSKYYIKIKNAISIII